MFKTYCKVSPGITFENIQFSQSVDALVHLIFREIVFLVCLIKFM
jgi:hypothetical protein